MEKQRAMNAAKAEFLHILSMNQKEFIFIWAFLEPKWLHDTSW